MENIQALQWFYYIITSHDNTSPISILKWLLGLISSAKPRCSLKKEGILFLGSRSRHFRPQLWNCLSSARGILWIKKKLSYFISEDFYEEKSLFTDDEPFFYRQLDWYNQFDVLIRKHLPFAEKNSIDFVRSYYFSFKYLVDYLILKSKMVQSFIEQSEPKSIHLLGFKFDYFFQNCTQLTFLSDYDIFRNSVDVLVAFYIGPLFINSTDKSLNLNQGRFILTLCVSKWGLM